MDSHSDVTGCIDVLLLLIAPNLKLNKEILMKAGAAKTPKYIPMNVIVVSSDLRNYISLSFFDRVRHHIMLSRKRPTISVVTRHS